jgi:hypothetical protein
MRKNDLIKKLQAIEGNPEVVLWNGYVGDWMPLGEPDYLDLVKITKEFWFRSVENERIRDGISHEFSEKEKLQLSRQWSKFQWEMNPHVTQEDVKNNWYKKKTVVVLDAKPKGVKTFDRLGGLEY